MFIAPDSVPEERPPMSIAAAQATGITKSLKKLDMPSASIARVGSWMRVKTRMAPDAPRKPQIAMMRRARATLPMRAASRGAT
jgi:hypothetical protein